MSAEQAIVRLAYLLAAVLFILGIRRMRSPATARSGNIVSAVGMLIALVVTLFNNQIVSWWEIIVGFVIGAVLGAVAAQRVEMRAMPQMVAAFNGLGGGAAALIAINEMYRAHVGMSSPDFTSTLASLLSTLIGALAFTGSIIAFGKLQGLVTAHPVKLPGQRYINIGLFVIAIGALVWALIAGGAQFAAFIVLVIAALVIGVAMVMPIGGADMPVVISLLNSFTGTAAAMSGFVLQNDVLIVGGALVGASGTILTRLMAKAMNRSLTNILFGAIGAPPKGGPALAEEGEKSVRSVGADDAAVALAYASSVIFVPGYGLAVAQAQHQLAELASLLESRGVDVKFGIHPVAGRMPGHMNVLLAEANVPYDKLYDLDEINPQFDRADVAVVVGANDVVNPAARNVPDAPIYGMPILNVDQAKSVLVIKRSLSPGFAQVDNPIFYMEKTMMLFEDAKKGLQELTSAVKEV